MDKKERQEILESAANFFESMIVENHIRACSKASKLSDYNINPFLVKYIAYFLTGKGDSQSMAKALVYPRLLCTSINTIFGTNMQKFISTLQQVVGSGISGVDIDFIDQIDKRKKYCQIKLGPNTINKDDVPSISGHFNTLKRRARTNHLSIEIDDLVIGVLYGTPDELSGHYKELMKHYPVYTGKDFWHRLTGDENFYSDLIERIGGIANKIDGTKILDETISKLSKEIEENPII